jgi:uncharacterized protein YfaP (DUF2135 family)
LETNLPIDGFDMIAIMHWNTDRTDVDLHVTEPNGETCYYRNPSTKSGGRITPDVTQGLGPEMYAIGETEKGIYRIKANYFQTDRNRTSTPTEVCVKVIRDLGAKHAVSESEYVRLEAAQHAKLILEVTEK